MDANHTSLTFESEILARTHRASITKENRYSNISSSVEPGNVLEAAGGDDCSASGASTICSDDFEDTSRQDGCSVSVPINKRSRNSNSQTSDYGSFSVDNYFLPGKYFDNESILQFLGDKSGKILYIVGTGSK